MSLAGAWGGTVTSLEAILTEKAESSLPRIDVAAQHFESAYWLMPTEDAFGDEIVATLNLTTTGSIPLLNASYSAKNVTQLFGLKVMSNYTHSDHVDFVNYTEVGLRFDAVNANSRSGKRLENEAPDVETYCLYSVGIDTAKT